MDTKEQMLDLHKDIFLQTSTGYEARLEQAFVDMGKGTVTSDEHVDVKLLNGTLSSDRLRITGGGEVVRFEGNVVMNLDNLRRTPPSSPPALRAGSPRRHRSHPGKARHFADQDRQHEMICMMMFSPREHFGSGGSRSRHLRVALFARDDRGRRRRRAERGVRACPTPCRAFRRIATSRSRSRPPRSRCATRKRKRPSPAM